VGIGSSPFLVTHGCSYKSETGQVRQVAGTYSRRAETLLTLISSMIILSSGSFLSIRLTKSLTSSSHSDGI
jgi:hypothetical protein